MGGLSCIYDMPARATVSTQYAILAGRPSDLSTRNNDQHFDPDASFPVS